ncbi:hypothetical protein [Microbulbifer discodermiae]|uniref:hypothetical protein n=1 Tax=Microbulbifer sp. 2201CG32-9 TaxID=3232309 RepID=UPI00345BB45E
MDNKLVAVTICMILFGCTTNRECLVTKVENEAIVDKENCNGIHAAGGLCVFPMLVKERPQVGCLIYKESRAQAISGVLLQWVVKALTQAKVDIKR